MSRFDKLPGIDESNTRRRNVVVGGVYALAGCVAIGAVIPSSENDEDTQNGPEPTDEDTTDEDTTDEEPDPEEDTTDNAEPVELRISVRDETENNPPGDRLELWIRNEGSMWPDLEFGGDGFEAVEGDFQRYETGEMYIYPDGRDQGVEIHVTFYFDEDFISDSPRDLVSVDIYDDRVEVSGTPIEAEHETYTLVFDR